MNSIWNKNLNAFKSRFPALAESIKPFINDFMIRGCSFYELSNAKNGQITATELTLRLHSTYNPEREAFQAVNQPAVTEKSSFVFYGFGLGYHVIEAAKLIQKQEKNYRLILIEPDVHHFLAAISILDWEEVFKIQNLIIAIGCQPEQVLPLIENTHQVNIGNTGVSDAYFFDIPAFTAHGKEYFDILRTLVQRNKQKNEINAATLKKFGKLWVRNSVKNLDKLTECTPISIFENKFSNVPFLIIGAGPSLEKLLPRLQELKSHAFIICVETALHTLLRHNIQPDFIILMDPQYWAYKHIAGLSATDSILITEISAYPSVFRFPCKKIALSSSQFPVGQYFEEKLNYFPGDLGTGGSVASSAWNFAYFCGAKEIYMAGLDLGFPGKQTHIKGSSAEQTFHKNATKVSTAERSGITSLFSGNATLGKNYLGEPVTTDARMKMFAWWFESRLAGCPETKTYTLCPEGLQIPGVNIASVNELIATPEVCRLREELRVLTETSQPQLNVNQLKKIKESFPEEEFFVKYSFLRPYFATIKKGF